MAIFIAEKKEYSNLGEVLDLFKRRLEEAKRKGQKTRKIFVPFSLNKRQLIEAIDILCCIALENQLSIAEEGQEIDGFGRRIFINEHSYFSWFVDGLSGKIHDFVYVAEDVPFDLNELTEEFLVLSILQIISNLEVLR